jgi:nucleoid-associated protein YgaU
VKNAKELPMSLFSFMKDVGEKLFTPRQASAAPGAAPSAAAPAAQVDQKTQDVANGETIKKYIAGLGLNVAGLSVSYDSSNYTATITGTAPDKETKEKAVLAAGNVMNVANVDDQMSVKSNSGSDAEFHTVEKGDTLSKISKEVYGDPNRYNKIFEANKPMLTSPDKIYPAQVLRIPA